MCTVGMLPRGLLGDLFQFPSNGKAHVHLPYFRPTPRLTPEALIQTRTARGFFLLKNWSENRLNPYEY